MTPQTNGVKNVERRVNQGRKKGTGVWEIPVEINPSCCDFRTSLLPEIQ
jgi:hypothetical protein